MPRPGLIKGRLDRAHHLLESGELTVGQIAGDVGFATALRRKPVWGRIKACAAGT